MSDQAIATPVARTSTPVPELPGLTPVEGRIFRRLHRSLGKVVTGDELLKGVWGQMYGGCEGDAHMLRVNIARLRPKLPAAYRIDTRPGVGYLLVEVERGADGPSGKGVQG